jgi:tetratricopeptide (TPR) repeat protein
MLAHTHLALGNLPAARQAAAKALEVGDPLTRANALQARGLIDMSAGKPRDAIPSFAEATRLAPQAEDGWLHLAGALRTVGDTAGAADACRRGLAANPSSTQLQALLGQLAPAR